MNLYESFRVSVEEALTRSGIIDQIVANMSSASEEELRVLKKQGDELSQKLNLLTAEKEEMSKLSTMMHRAERQLQVAKKLVTQEKHAATIADLNAKYEIQLRNFQKNVIETFRLEHTLMDTLTARFTNLRSNTSTYAVYYKGKSSGEILRGEIAAEDLYSSDYIYVTEKGTIQMSKKILQDTTGLVQNITSTIAANEIGTYDPSFQKDLEDIIQSAAAFFKDVQDKYVSLRQTASGEHLGGYRDNELDSQAAALDDESAVMELMETHVAQMQASFFTSQKGGFKGSRINKGHIAEAYERLRQSRVNGDSKPSFYGLVEESLGNDPWYISGDVGDVQVKTFLDNNDRQIATFGSIIELGSNLYLIISSLVARDETELQGIRARGQERIKAKEQFKWANGDKELARCISQEIQPIFAPFE